jgi:hypothetical protein
MITGDQKVTALAIAKEMGIVAEGERAEERVHARVSPEQKLNIVREWKAKGAIVAMTGDGVNDAPALKEAHVGVAMGIAGTEVTREAADIVLADDNFASIIAGVREGRAIFDNIRKTLVYLLTGNAAELLLMLIAAIAGLPVPLLPIHLLWINLVTDGLPALALSLDPTQDDVLKRPPRDAAEPMLGRAQWIRVGVIGAFEAALTLGVYLWALDHGPVEAARDLAFTTLVFSELMRSFAARSDTRTLPQLGAASNLRLLAVVVLTGAAQVGMHLIPGVRSVFGLHPLSWGELGLCFALGLIPVTILEVTKLVRAAPRGSNTDADPPVAPDDRALVVEGQATWVESQLCDDIMARQSVLGGLSARGKMSPGEESYALGWWFMDSLVARWGVEATWAALESPPRRDDVRALFDEAPVEKMPRFNAHIRMLARARLGGFERAQMRSRATITDVLLWEALRGPAVRTPGGDLARVSVEMFSTYADAFVPARAAVTTVGWYHIRDPSAGARWLEKRCAALTGDRSGVSSVGSMTPDAMLLIDESAQLINAPFIDLVKLAPEAQARCAVTGTIAGVNYTELWVLQDNTLRMMAQTYTGPTVKKPKALIKAFTVYLRKSKHDPSREQAFTAGLEALVPTREGAAATPSWTRHVSRGTYDLYRRRWSSCVSRAQQVLQAAPEASQGQGAWLIYYCGTMSDDPELTRTAVELVREDYDLISLAAGLDQHLRERGEDILAEQFMARHCVEFRGADPRCGR